MRWTRACGQQPCRVIPDCLRSVRKSRLMMRTREVHTHVEGVRLLLVLTFWKFTIRVRRPHQLLQMVQFFLRNSNVGGKAPTR